MAQSISRSDQALTYTYVDPLNGDDGASGTLFQPYRTISHALRQAIAGTEIHVSPGTYSVNMGERFPLIIPPDVTVLGDPQMGDRAGDPSDTPPEHQADPPDNHPLQNQTSAASTEIETEIEIVGGGPFLSQDLGHQLVAVVLHDRSTLSGITVTNPIVHGTGVWIEAAAPTLDHCRFIHCQREGVVVAAGGRPLVSDCVFAANRTSGLLFLQNGAGEIRRNLFRNTGYGIAIRDAATPLIIDNQVIKNRSGVVIAGTARPSLRRNHITHNQQDGLTILNTAQPDLGTEQQPGGNAIAHNHRFDIQSQSSHPLTVSGNYVTSERVRGSVSIINPKPDMPTPPPAPLLPLQRQRPQSQSQPQVASLASVPVASPPPTDRPGGNPLPTDEAAVTNPFSTDNEIPVASPFELPLSMASMALTSAPAAPSPFPDLSNHWAKAFIESLHQDNIIQGFPDGAFKPDWPLTRAQYAALIAKMFDLPTVAEERPFRDVPDEFWAVDAIQKATRMGFIAGFPDGSFRPNNALTRTQAIVSLVNGLRLTGGAADGVELYGDRADIPTYAIEEVAIATHKQLVVNHPEPTQLEPTRPISRAEMATMLYQVKVMTGQAQAIASPFLVQPPPVSRSFQDVDEPTPHWASAFIYGLVRRQWLKGMAEQTFAPERAMSRAECATLLAQTFSPLPKTDLQSFVDVPRRFWAHDAIQRVVQAGLMAGFDDGSFQPGQDVKRWQLFLALVNALDLPPVNPNQLSRYYNDVESIPMLARGAIATASQHQLVVNHPTLKRINANRGATRAEVAAALYQSLALMGRLDPVDSPFIVSALPDPLPPPAPVPAPTPSTPLPIRSPAPTPPETLLLPTVVLSTVINTTPVNDLESYLFGFTNQATLIAQSVSAQLLQQGFNVVLQRSPNAAASVDHLMPTDSDVLIRLQILDQPLNLPQSAEAILQTPPSIDEVAWQLFSQPAAQSVSGLALAQILHPLILEETGLGDRGIQPTETLWPDRDDAQQVTPGAAVLLTLNPVMRPTTDYPAIPSVALVRAIATGILVFVDEQDDLEGVPSP